MLSAAFTRLGIRKFEAKIGLDNTVSIAVFKKLGFGEVGLTVLVYTSEFIWLKPLNKVTYKSSRVKSKQPYF